MIRFVDMSPHFSERACAFLNVDSYAFVGSPQGGEIFLDAEEIAEHEFGSLLATLVPPGFWEATS